MSLQPQQGDGIATWFPAACVSPGVFFSGFPWLQLLSSPSSWFCARLVLSYCGLGQSCSSASPSSGAILRSLLFPGSSPRHSGLSGMPIQSLTAASGSVLGELRVKMLQGFCCAGSAPSFGCARSLSVSCLVLFSLSLRLFLQPCTAGHWSRWKIK